MTDVRGPAALGPAERALVELSAALAAAGAAAEAPGLEEALHGAAGTAPPVQVEEALVQSYLFLGYPSALNALALWRRVGGAAAPAATDDRGVDWTARGEEVCRRVYAGQYEGLRDNVRALHPDMERWMVQEGYGKVLGRPGLTLDVRELCVAAILAVVGAPTQLYSHLRGALNAGATPEEVEAALRVALEHATPERGRLALDTWRRVLSRREAATADESTSTPRS